MVKPLKSTACDAGMIICRQPHALRPGGLFRWARMRRNSSYIARRPRVGYRLTVCSWRAVRSAVQREAGKTEHHIFALGLFPIALSQIKLGAYICLMLKAPYLRWLVMRILLSSLTHVYGVVEGGCSGVSLAERQSTKHPVVIVVRELRERSIELEGHPDRFRTMRCRSMSFAVAMPV